MKKRQKENLSIGVVQPYNTKYPSHKSYTSKLHSFSRFLGLLFIISNMIVWANAMTLSFKGQDIKIITAISIPLFLVMLTVDIILDMKDDRIYINETELILKKGGIARKYMLGDLKTYKFEGTETVTFTFVNNEVVTLKRMQDLDNLQKHLENLHHIITHPNHSTKEQYSRPNITPTGKMAKCYGSGHKLVTVFTVVFFVVLVCALICFGVICRQADNTIQISALTLIALVSCIDSGLGLATILLRYYKCDYIAYNDEGFIVKAWRDKTFSKTGEKQSFLWSDLRGLTLNHTELTLIFADGKTMKVYNLVNCQPFIDMAQNQIDSNR